MNKNSFIAILVSLALGIGLGFYISTLGFNNDKELLDLYKRKIEVMDSVILLHKKRAELYQQQINDTNHLLDLNKTQLDSAFTELNKAKADGVKVQQKLKEFQKLNSNEKAAWFNNRYSH